MSWVGCVSQFYYKFHLDKFHGRKKDLTNEIQRFGDRLLEKNRQLKTLDSSDLTRFTLSFKSTGKSIRVDKSTAEEHVGADTLYRLAVNKKQTSKASSSAGGKKRKKLSSEESDSDEDEEEEEEEVDDNKIGQDFVAGRKRKAPEPYIPSAIPRRNNQKQTSKASSSAGGKKRKKLSNEESDSDEDEEEEEVDDNKIGQDFVAGRKRKTPEPYIPSAIPRRNNTTKEEKVSRDKVVGMNQRKSTDDSDEEKYFKHLCGRLTNKAVDLKSKIAEKDLIIETQQSEIDSLRNENEWLRIEIESLRQKVRAHHPIDNAQIRVSNKRGYNGGGVSKAHNWK
jgi:hypothetical protein